LGQLGGGQGAWGDEVAEDDLGLLLQVVAEVAAEEHQ
jgi:hypothetical protein